MLTLQRIIRLSLLPMAIFLPVWLTFGRAMFGVAGWGMLAYLFILAPALLVLLLAIALFVASRKDVRATGRVGRTDAMLLTALYATVFLHGFFAIDAGDTRESIASVASVLFGSGFVDASATISVLLFFAAVVLLCISVVVTAQERWQGKAARPTK